MADEPQDAASAARPAPRWLVDGMNVIGARPDGWWRDRRAAMRSLTALLHAFAERGGEPGAVVFDGRPGGSPPAGGERVEVAFAAYADDEIVRRVAAHPDPAALQVVTSDAELARRVRALGAAVVGAGAFRARLDREAAG